MALNFPSAPSANATYTFNDKSWTYNGNAWALTTATLSTSVVPEGSNLYFTNARARTAISVTGSGSYDNTTGVITITGGVSSVGGASGAVSNAQIASGIASTSISNLTLTGNITAGNVTISSGGALTFPDGSRQTTSPGTLLNIITRTSNVGLLLQNKTFSVQGRSANTTITIT
jgi:hypothetical protein